MTDRVVYAWSDILERMPNSKLLLKSRHLGNRCVANSVGARFADHGINRERLILEGPSGGPEYFEAYNRIDLVLDTFPYPGGTTSFDALWMGVPVLTLKGDRFLSRLGETISLNSGQSDWIARDQNDYVDKAISYSADVQKLSNLRQILRDKVSRSPLFDIERFAKHFENALQHMWECR